MIELIVKHDRRTISIKDELTDGTSLYEFVKDFIIPAIIGLGWDEETAKEIIWTETEAEKVYTEGYNAGLQDARAEQDHARELAEEDFRQREVERLEKESLGISYG